MNRFMGTQPIDEKFINKSKAFCMMPWVHLHVTQLGTITPCCQTPWQKEHALGDINEADLMSVWNSPGFKSFRKKMLADEKDPRCAKCYNMEAFGIESIRQATNTKFINKLNWVNNTAADGSSEDSKPIYLDIRFSNLCNFRCRICGPWSSSKWADDAKALGIMKQEEASVTRAIEDASSFFTTIEQYAEEIEEVYFAGGEPLMMEEHYQLLDFLERKGNFNVYLRYSTNFSIERYKRRSIFDIWSKFKNIRVNASLDDEGKRGELQRKGMNWQDTIDLRRKMIEKCPHVEFRINPMVNIFNVFNLPNFHKSWVQQGLVEVENFWPSMLEQPEAYNVRILPEALKQRISAKYEEHISWIQQEELNDSSALITQFRSIIDYMNAQDESIRLPEFKARCQELDLLREESCREVFTELAEYDLL